MSHMERAWAQQQSCGREKAVLVALAFLADDRGLGRVTVEEIASMTEMSVSSVSNHLAALKKQNCYLLTDFIAGRGRRKAIPTATRRLVFQRDEGCCCECGATERLQFDHIYPWSLGGSDDPENLQLLCKECNWAKGVGASGLVQGR